MSASVAQPCVGGSGVHASSAATYLPFVRRVVLRLARRLPSHVRVEDLMGAGIVGLLEAMERYDPSRATDFEAFAEFRVKGALLDELRRRDLMARDARLASKQIEEAIGVLAQRLGREPEEPEIAQQLGLSVGELRLRLEKLTPVHVFSFDETDDAAFVSSEENPFEATARHELIGRLANAITRLSERQQQVLQLYYREDLTMREIGVVLEVTESRVCQILTEATLKLRAALTLDESCRVGREREPGGCDG
jgi:RNA polymerase sigma factor FliA